MLQLGVLVGRMLPTTTSKVRIHFSKCNNNQLFSEGRISLRGRDSSTTRPTIPWTSKTKQIRHSLRTHRHQTRGTGAAPRPPNKKTSTPATTPTQSDHQAQWALTTAKSVRPAASSSCHRLCKVEATRRHPEIIDRASSPKAITRSAALAAGTTTACPSMATVR